MYRITHFSPQCHRRRSRAEESAAHNRAEDVEEAERLLEAGGAFRHPCGTPGAPAERVQQQQQQQQQQQRGAATRERATEPLPPKLSHPRNSYATKAVWICTFAVAVPPGWPAALWTRPA